MAPAATPLSRAAVAGRLRGGGGEGVASCPPLARPTPPPPASLPRAAPPSCKRTTGGAELRRCLCLSPSPPAGLPSPGAGGPEPAGKAFRKGARPPAQPTSAGCVRAGHPPFPSALSPSPHGVPPPEEGASSPSPQGPCGRGGGLSWAAPFLGCRELLAVRQLHR